MVEELLELLGLGLSIGFRSIASGLCNIIYWLISRLFQLFMIVSQLNILSSDEIGPIYERITLILTIVMVFYITFEFVKYVVQPDTMTDKEQGVGNIVKRMIIAIVLIAFVPRIFTIAYDLQNKLITNQVFSKIILGEKNIEFDTFGSAFSADMLGVFYGLDEGACGGSNYDALCEEAEQKVESNLKKLREGNKVTLLPGIGYSKEMEVDGNIENVFAIRFDGLLAVIIGAVILYLVVLYTIDVGTRYAQLIFLQIMSPIAIIGFISPKKDNIFSKWLKQCLTTYLDLFIRLTIIYFVLLIIDALGDSYSSGSLFAGVEGVEGFKTLAYIALVMGLLVFAGKAPKMIGELLPVSGGAASIGYGLKGGDRFSPTFGGIQRTWNAGRRVVGATAGLATGVSQAIKNKTGFWSGTKAAYRGLKAGAGKGGSLKTGKQAALGSINEDRDVLDAGGTILGHDFRGVHYQEEKEETQRKKKTYEEVIKSKEGVSTETSGMKIMKTTLSYKNDWNQQGIGDASQRDTAAKDIEKATRVFAVSDKGDTAKAVFQESIRTAVNKVYTEAAKIDRDIAAGDKTFDTLTGQEKEIIERRNETVDNIWGSLDENSKTWNTLSTKIANAKRDTSPVKDIIVTVKDENGKLVPKTIQELTPEEFAAYLGDIEDATKNKIAGLDTPEAKRAEANAAKPK